MTKYLVKRFLLMFPTLLGVAILIFFLIRIVPGDVVELRLAGDSGAVNAKVLADERAKHGLDRPVWQQFLNWLWGAVRLDFGTSMWTGPGRPVRASLNAFGRNLPRAATGCAWKLRFVTTLAI